VLIEAPAVHIIFVDATLVVTQRVHFSLEQALQGPLSTAGVVHIETSICGFCYTSLDGSNCKQSCEHNLPKHSQLYVNNRMSISSIARAVIVFL